MQAAISGDIDAYTTPAVLHIVSYFLAKARGVVSVKVIIVTLLNDVTIIDCSHATAVLTVNSSITDVEDALQYYTALAHKADYFISSDVELKKAALPQLPVYTAAGFVAAWRRFPRGSVLQTHGHCGNPMAQDFSGQAWLARSAMSRRPGFILDAPWHTRIDLMAVCCATWTR